MPFEPTNEELKRLLFQALATEKLDDQADQAGLPPEVLLAKLEEKTQEISEAVASEQIEVDNRQREYDADLDGRVTRALERDARLLQFMRRLWPAAVVLPAVYIALKIFKVQAFYMYVITERSTWQIIVGMLILYAFVYGWYSSTKESRDKRETRLRKEFEQEKDFLDLKKRIDDAKAQRDAAAIAQGIKPVVKEIVDARLNLTFTQHLPELDFSGLSEVFSSANEIATDAKRELEFLLNKMPGGSIGIAGPRGSGKSTLLKSACADLPNNLEERRVIPLLTTSPVEYHGRDFILHIFSTMCVKILETTTTRKRTHSAWDEVAELRRPETVSIFRTLWPIAPFALVIGIALVILSALLAAIIASTPSPASSGNSSTQSAAAQAQPAATQPPSPAQTASPNAVASPSPSQSPSFGTRMILTLDLKPGIPFISGVLLILFYAVLYNYPTVGVDRFNQRYAAGSSSLINRLKLPEEVQVRLEETTEEARKWLREIKFQQSYTSGWSGNLKLPIGLEGGINSAISLAQQQLSLPDITGGFCNFLSRIARDFKIIIGIDELDKLESDEAAQRFLNEIKAIFGLSNVFYLVSVSENAMSSFERRGLPFRDVFDSSFDNIIYVEYLKLEQAKRLIARRVVAMPPPFVHLCHCISGGLARDLVRVCRNLMQHSHNAYAQDPAGANSNLRALTQLLIKSDLTLKLNALTVVAKRLDAGPALSEFLDKLYSLEERLDSVPELIKAYADLMKAAKPTPATGDGADGAAGLVQVYDTLKQRLTGDVPRASDKKTLASLHEELASYIYYSVTVLEFFSNTLDETNLAQTENQKRFDELARARQYLAINPSITRSMLDKFRGDFQMTVPSIATSVTAMV